MPVTIKTANMKYKNSDGEYVGINAVSETSTAEQITAIQSVGTTIINNVQAKGVETLATIPDDYTELNNKVNDIENVIKNSNLNQLVYTNPFITSSTIALGKVRSNRAILTVLESTLKITRNSDSPTNLNFGYYVKFKETYDPVPIGHKLFIQIDGIDCSGITSTLNFIKISGYSSPNQTNQGFVQNIESSKLSSKITFENIFTIDASIDTITVYPFTVSNPANEGEYFTVDNMQIIDLTEMFGEGYEPSLETFKSIYGSGMPYPYCNPNMKIDLQETKTILKDFGEIITKDYSPTKTYNIGDYVYYNNKLYLCKTNIIEPESWDSTHWSSANLDEISFVMRGSIKENADLNNLLKNGIYLLFTGYTYDNAPHFYNNGAAYLINLQTKDMSYLIQLFVTNSNSINNPKKKYAIRTSFITGGNRVFTNWSTLLGQYDDLIGKKFSVLGDSISTYSGYIPSGYAYYYPKNDTVVSSKSVNDVNKTWWKLVEKQTGMVLLKNASWSGSGVCFGINNGDTFDNARVAYSDARIADLSDDGTNPDIIIVMIGTNDFRKATSTTGGLGVFTEVDELPSGDSEITTFNEAYAVMLNKIHIAYPHAHVYCCTLLTRSAESDRTYPIIHPISGTNIKYAVTQYNKVITDISSWLSCVLIDISSVFNLSEIDDYTLDDALHPNSDGMKLIANRIINALVENEKSHLEYY